MSSNTDSAATYSSNNATITIQLTITAAAGAPRVPLTLSSPTTAAELRRQVGSTTHIPLSSLRLIYRGRLINDSDQNDVVAEFKLEEGSVLHCMGKPEQAPAQNTASESTPAAIPSVTVVPAVSSATATPPAASETSLDLPSALQQMRTANTPAVYLTGVTTLDKILSNIITHPLEEKYRTLKIQNPAFQRRLGGITGGDRAIRACGFIVISTGAGESAYTMTASPEQWPALVQAKATLEQAVRQASSAATASSAPPLMASANAAAPPLGSAFPWGSPPGALPPMEGLRNTPEVQQMAAQLFSNPQQLQFMLQNPMIQTMLRNDPQLANNPEMVQAIDEMIRNPEVLSQMSQMMSDPLVQSMLLNNPEAMQQFRNPNRPTDAQAQQFQQMLQLMSQSGGGVPPTDPTLPSQYQNLMPRRMAGLAPSRAAGTNPPASSSAPVANDTELTEEEMIAEAIRRSLQDNNNNGGGGGS